jgi:divalent metal cation (Fe/Co/Zn/Cd) transporter
MMKDVLSVMDDAATKGIRQGQVLEGVTLGWNVLAIVTLTVAAFRARSVALGGFGLDSLIEIGASLVVLWELADRKARRRAKAVRLIGYAFVVLGVYLILQSAAVLLMGAHPRHSLLGIAWTAVTAVVMFLLAAGKRRVGTSMSNPVLLTEGRVTLIDGLLATAVLVGLVLNAAFNWWWADPLSALVVAAYAVYEAYGSLRA